MHTPDVKSTVLILIGNINFSPDIETCSNMLYTLYLGFHLIKIFIRKANSTPWLHPFKGLARLATSHPQAIQGIILKLIDNPIPKSLARSQ